MTLTLEVGTYKWDVTHRRVMMHVFMNFYEILKEKGIFDLYLCVVCDTPSSDDACLNFYEILKEKGIFDICPLFVILTLEVIIKWYAKIGRAQRLNSSHANISYAVFCLKKKIVL